MRPSGEPSRGSPTNVKNTQPLIPSIVSVTGMGGEDDTAKGELATRFQLFHHEEEVARCHLSYRDGSYDPSLGPTIEMLAVKQSRRGEGLAKVLWYHVRRFIEQYFTLECLNHDAPDKHVLVKATQVGTNEVEIREDKDGKRHPMSFKAFLYDYCGFSVRIQKGAMAYLMGKGRPKDEEAVLYIPLVPRGGPSSMKEPKPGKAMYREKLGARMCFYCSEVNVKLERCARCGIAYYCDRNCQVKDWPKRHKFWCNKTLEQLRATMIERSDMTVGSNGEKTVNIRCPYLCMR